MTAPNDLRNDSSHLVDNLVDNNLANNLVDNNLVDNNLPDSFTNNNLANNNLAHNLVDNNLVDNNLPDNLVDNNLANNNLAHNLVDNNLPDSFAHNNLADNNLANNNLANNNLTNNNFANNLVDNNLPDSFAHNNLAHNNLAHNNLANNNPTDNNLVDNLVDNLIQNPHLLAIANLIQNPHLLAIANQFKSSGQIIQIEPYGTGNINQTFRVTLQSESPQNGAHLRTCFILQRMNQVVFCQPQAVMQNLRVCTTHIKHRLQQDQAPYQALFASENRRWELPQVLLTQTGADHWLTPEGEFWRALSFIDRTQSFDIIQDPNHAQEVGYALGLFHHLISDLSPDSLTDTLADFHITPAYLRRYEQVKAMGDRRQYPSEYTPSEYALEIQYCTEFVADRQVWATVLETAKTAGELPLRPIHGDPKINNILFDKETRKAVSMVDLDTVKPGLIHYDIGDCLRSACNRSGEETQAWERVEFDTDLCAEILRSYSAIARSFLTEADYGYFYAAIRLIAFELGLRFFTDYLEGDRYFKTDYPHQNLIRALVQFKLTESIENQEKQIQALIKDLYPHRP